jgi:hypothetical protein
MKKAKGSDTKGSDTQKKKAQMFRLPPDVADLLLIGSRKTGIDKTAYVIFALKHQFQADGLLPPEQPFPATATPATDFSVEILNAGEIEPGRLF